MTEQFDNAVHAVKQIEMEKLRWKARAELAEDKLGEVEELHRLKEHAEALAENFKTKVLELEARLNDAYRTSDDLMQHAIEYQKAETDATLDMIALCKERDELRSFLDWDDELSSERNGISVHPWHKRMKEWKSQTGGGE